MCLITIVNYLVLKSGNTSSPNQPIIIFGIKDETMQNLAGQTRIHLNAKQFTMISETRLRINNYA